MNHTLIPAKAFPAEVELTAQVERIIQSPAFSGSEILRQLLTYLASRAIESPGEHLKVKEIATRVFHRAEDFDSQTDSVVRVHIGRLRSKLAEYYMSEGSQEEVILEVPRGAYFLSSYFRSPPLAVSTESLPAALVEVPALPAESAPLGPKSAPGDLEPGSASRGIFRLALPWTLAAALLLLSGWQAYENRKLSGLRQEQDAQSHLLPWSALLAGNRQINIVASDAGFAFAQDLARNSESLTDYIGGVCPVASPGDMAAVTTLLCRREFTVWADVVAATRILGISPRVASRSVVRYGRYMHIEDFKGASSVLLGTVRSNHWIELFDQNLNFHMEYDQKLGKHFCRNRSPQPGEPEIYMPAGPTGTTGEAFGTIALKPNLSGDGFVLLLTGTNTESTQAAAEFVTNPAKISGTLRAMGVDPKGSPRPFEILLKVGATAGSPDTSALLAYRTARAD